MTSHKKNSLATTSTCHEFVAARDFLLCHRDDYETTYRDFRWPRPDRFNWAIDYFDIMAENNSRPALRIVQAEGLKSFSFAEMSRQSNKLANYLQSLGVKRSDVILIMLGNEPSLWLAILAAMKLGAVVVPTSLLMTSHDLTDRINRGRVSCIITRHDHIEKFTGIADHCTRICTGDAPGWFAFDDYAAASSSFIPQSETCALDPMLLYFTSGTTAQPKLVIHSHNYPIGSLSTMYWIGIRPGDVHLNISSPGWAKHAWSSFFAPWNAEAAVLVVDEQRFNPKTILEVIRDEDVTTLCAPPTVWRMLIQENIGDYRNKLREAVSAGEPLNPEIITRVQKEWDVTIRDGYGQTETTAQIGNTPGQKVTAGSVGKPLPGYRIRILNEQDEDATEGEVAISLNPPPAGLMIGYLQPDGTVSPLQDDVYRTGDLASIDDDGSLTFVGRTDDVFKASGYRISPFELESLLLEHPCIAEAAVVPAADPVRTTVPKAFVRLAVGYTSDRKTALDIFQHIKERISPYKKVRRLEFCDLPKTMSGKILRSQLRRQEAANNGQRKECEFYESDFPELK